MTEAYREGRFLFLWYRGTGTSGIPGGIGRTGVFQVYVPDRSAPANPYPAYREMGISRLQPPSGVGDPA